jgi:hypothetical protein
VTLLSILLLIFLTGIGCVVAIFLIPLELRIDASDQRPEKAWGQLVILKTIKIPLRPGKAKKKKSEQATQAGKPMDFPRVSDSASGKKVWAFLSSENLITRTVDFLGKLVTEVKIRHGRMDIRFGLDNPADTGQMFAALSPFIAMGYAFFPKRFVILPDFSGNVLRYDIQLNITVRLADIVSDVVSYILSREFRAALKASRRAQ